MTDRSDGLYVGVMSGSSLDGLDVVACEWLKGPPSTTGNDSNYQILESTTLPIPHDLISALKSAPDLAALDLLALDSQYGKFIGEALRSWLSDHDLKPLAIGCHGHTVFHFPAKGVSFQLGKGAEIANITGLPVVTDFRAADMAAGGQGAPMIGIAEELLFPDYDLYLNLGGICNATIRTDRGFISYDIGVCNQLLNYLASQAGLAFDDGGKLASAGKVQLDRIHQLRKEEWYHLPPPKSLDNSFFSTRVKPVFDQSDDKVEDKLATAVAFICECIAKSFESQDFHVPEPERILITGGGAFNTFLIETLGRQLGRQLSLPSESIIHFKEAIMVALAARLCIAGVPNFIPSTTGAKLAAIGGVIHQPPKS